MSKQPDNVTIKPSLEYTRSQVRASASDTARRLIREASTETEAYTIGRCLRKAAGEAAEEAIIEAHSAYAAMLGAIENPALAQLIDDGVEFDMEQIARTAAKEAIIASVLSHVGPSATSVATRCAWRIVDMLDLDQQ